MNFIIYDQLGKILRTGACPEEFLDLQAQKDEYCLPGLVDSSRNYILAGAIVIMPPKPTTNHVFDYAVKSWVDPRTLGEQKSAQWTRIKQAREAALTAPLSTPYGVFDADEAASASILKSVLLANNLAALGQPVAIAFTLADNTVVVLDAGQMVRVGLLLAAREQTIRATATALRTRIEQATTPAEVEAVAW